MSFLNVSSLVASSSASRRPEAIACAAPSLASCSMFFYLLELNVALSFELFLLFFELTFSPFVTVISIVLISKDSFNH